MVERSIDNCRHRPSAHVRGCVYALGDVECERHHGLGDSTGDDGYDGYTTKEYCGEHCEDYEPDEKASRFKNTQIPLGDQK